LALNKSFTYLLAYFSCVYDAQEEEARQIALLEEAMRASPSLVSAFSDQLQRDNASMRSFRGGHEPRRSFSTMDNRSHLVGLLFIPHSLVFFLPRDAIQNAVKAIIYYTRFPVASPQQVRNMNDKSVTSWRGQKSVVSVVSYRFPSSITSDLLRTCWPCR